MTGTAIASRLAASILNSANFLEDGRLYRHLGSSRNEYGEPVSGPFVRYDVQLVTDPISGEERMALEEGLREEEVRKFWIKGQRVNAILGASNGDVIYWNGRIFRVVQVDQRGPFVEVMAVLPTDADIAALSAEIDFDPADFALEDWA